MSKAHYETFKKIAVAFGLFVIAFLIGWTASSTNEKNDGDALVEAAPPAVTTTTATTTETATTEPQTTVAPAVESFRFNPYEKTIEFGNKITKVDVNTTFGEEEKAPATITAKAVVNGKTVLFSGKVPSCLVEPIVCEFKNKQGFQCTKLPDGCFVSATIE